MNYKLGSDSKLIHSSNSTTTMTMNNSNNSLNSLENSENIHPILYSPYSCGKFLNKVMISNERKEPNEKQKIIIFRITDDNHQGQLELYKFFGNEADDTSINLETSPTSVSNLNNNISPRKKSFSYSPSNSISLTSLTNPGDDILNSKIKVQKMIQWDLHRKKNWPPVKLNIK
eukprot:jgi/Orpsp1_1/1187314/evm.model.d7180000056816.1